MNWYSGPRVGDPGSQQSAVSRKGGRYGLETSDKNLYQPELEQEETGLRVHQGPANNRAACQDGDRASLGSEGSSRRK